MLLEELRADNLQIAAEIAALVMAVRGFGHVKTDVIGNYVLPSLKGTKFLHTVVSVIDNTAQYIELMKKLFDFD